jgi:hypothetical protein
MTTHLREAVAALIATARATHPACPGWQLTMNPETFLLFNPEPVVTDLARQHMASFYDGCRVWPEPTWADAVVCSPLVDPGTWDLPPEYYLDLRDNTISTDPPQHTRRIQAAQGSPG